MKTCIALCALGLFACTAVPATPNDERSAASTAKPKRETPAASPAPADLGDVRITEDCFLREIDKGALDECFDQKPLYAARIEKQSDGSDILVFWARSWTIAPGALIHVDAGTPIAFSATGDIRVEGQLLALSFGNHPSAGGPEHGGPGAGGKGAGGVGTTDGSSGGSYCGRGGDGAGAGGGNSGKTYGDAALDPLLPGSSGGGSSGGGGGGAIRITAGGALVVGTTGVVTAPGGGGEDAWGGGGGSGGAILLEGETVTIAGAVSANGGGGNVEGGLHDPNQGGPRDEAAPGATPNAGAGAAGDRIEGGDGAIDPSDANNPGAGGGGAGRIRILSRTGAATVTPTGVISPALGTACATEAKKAR